MINFNSIKVNWFVCFYAQKVASATIEPLGFDNNGHELIGVQMDYGNESKKEEQK